MRICVSGTSSQGKSTFIKDFLKQWSMYNTPEVTYRSFIKNKHSKKGNKDMREEGEALETTLRDYFMPTISPGTMQYKNMIEYMEKGQIKKLFPLIGRRPDGEFKQKGPIFSIDKGALGINASVQGHMLNRAMEKNVFFTKDFDLSVKERGTIQGHLDNLDNTISAFEAFGNKSKEEMEFLSNYDHVFKGIDRSEGMRKANTYGIMREIAHSQLKREHGTLYALENDRFKDVVAIEVARDRLFRARKAVDILDQKMTDLTASYKPKTVKRIKFGKNQKSVNSPFEGTVYRKPKKVIFDKTLKKKPDIRKLEYAGYIKKDWKLRVQQGYDYFIDTNPVEFKNIASEEGKQQRAFARATKVGKLDAEYLLSISKSPSSDQLYQEIIDMTMKTKTEIGREYSALLTNINKQKFNFSNQFQYNSVKTDRIIDAYFSRMVIDHKIEPAQLIRYLIQPSIQRNVFYQDGGDIAASKMPYYKMNDHLVSSVLSWLIKPPMEAGGWLSNADKYGIDGQEIVRDLVGDMNAFRTGNFDHFSDAIKQSNGMRTNSYSIDFDRFSQTTKDVIGKDWFYHPVLSRFMKQFYINTGSPFIKDKRMWIQFKNTAPKESKYGCNY